jgi:hypothetical protein
MTDVLWSLPFASNLPPCRGARHLPPVASPRLIRRQVADDPAA